MQPTPQRFVIIADARTGSTYLKNLLRSHPEVLCFGEVLNSQNILWDIEDYNVKFNTPSIRATRDANPCAFVDSVFNLGGDCDVKCVGFKSLYRQYSATPQYKALIPHLMNNDSIKVIHLKRLNTFKKYCSLQIASKRVARGTSMNAYRADDVEKAITITVNPEMCLDYIENSTIAEKKFDTLFDGDTHEVNYEELAADTEQVMDGVLDFLDLPSAPLGGSTHKVRQQPISEVVSNYDEVAAFLTKKGYGQMFVN